MKEIIKELHDARNKIEAANEYENIINMIKTVVLPEIDQSMLSVTQKFKSMQKIRFLYFFEVTGCVTGAILGKLFGFLIGGIFGHLMSILLSFVFSKLHLPINKKKKIKAQIYYNEQMDILQEKKEDVLSELDGLERELRALEIPEALSSQYCNIEALEYVINILESNKAETIDEALILYQAHMNSKLRIDV